MRTTAAMVSRQCMLPTSIMARLPDIPVPIPSLVALEVIELLRSTSRQRPVVPVARIIPVIYVPVEAAMPMKPRSRTDKHAAIKPIRPVIPVRCTVIRRIVEVPIRAIRRNADPDNNL